MSPKDLPAAYFFKASTRLKAVAVLFAERNYSDVVRESQEIVELCSKAILRLALMDPPHRHDVAKELLSVKDRFPAEHHPQIDALAKANHWLRREREMAFYGASDFDPTEGYSEEDGQRAINAATAAVQLLHVLRT